MSTTKSRRWLTINEVAEELGLHHRTIRRAINSGELKAVRPGGTTAVRIDAADLADWLTPVVNARTTRLGAA